MAESKSATVVFTDSSLLAKNAQAAAGSAKSAADNAYNMANNAQRTADGKNSIYRGSDPSTVPTAILKVGDLYFSENAAYIWNGSSWEETVSDTTGKDIHAKVEEAMAESKKSVAELKSDVEAKVKELDDEIAQNEIKTGNALNFYKEQYYLSNSYTELVGGSWSDEVPPRKVEGKYVWSRYVTANVGDPTNQQYSKPVCISGLDGEQGPQGPQGVPGEKGADGRTTYVHVAYADSADGKSNFSVNYFADALYIGVLTDYTQADSTDYTQYTWSRLKGDAGDQGIPGPKGADGRTTYVHFAYANITQLAQETWSPEFALSTQTVVRFGDEASGKWIYKDLPAGKYTASVGLFGSDPALGIYKVVQSFSDFSVTESNGRAYIGQYTDYTQADSTDPASYKWTKIKGETGPQGATGPQGPKGDTGDQGIPGPKGADGQTTYVHFAYANSADGKTDFNVSYFSNALYVGTYTDYTPTDSNDYTKYTWSRLKGDTGNTGATGPKGDTGDTGFFIGTTPPPNPAKGTVWATNDSSGNMNSAKTWNGSSWVSTAFTQDLVAGNITATKIVGGELDVNKITVKNAQNIPITSTASLGKKLSDMEQDADGLLLTVKNDGQNLLRDTDTMPFWTGDTEKVDTFKAVKAINTRTDGGPYDPIAWNGLTCIKPNTDYTLTFYARADQNGVTIYSYLYNIGTNTAYKDGSTRNTLSTNYQRYEVHFHTENFSDGRTVNCLPMRIYTPNVACYIYGVQLEEGAIATAWSPSPSDISALKVTSDSLNAYVNGSRGSKTLEAILSMDPDHSSIAQVVNGQVAAAIGTYSDGSVRIDGKALYINADTKIENATIKSAMIDSIEADKITTGTLNADKVNIINLNADKITSGTLNGMTITGSTFIATGQQKVLVNDSGFEVGSMKGSKAKLYAGGLEITTDINDSLGERLIDLVILDKDAGPYIKIKDGKKDSETHISSGIIQTPDARIGPIHISYHHIRSDATIWISNDSDSNFNNQGSVGLQIEAGVGLGKNTIYTYTNDLYIQKGLVVNGELYSSASKTTIHCQKVISQVANTVSSRLSVKTDITPVTYDRALAAVEGTEMYDYRYISDDSGQHYVSGIIDDVNPDPQYHMDDMLINKERTARIDANLVGYHHVILQELLKKIDELEIKVKSLETRLESKEK